MKRMKTFLAAFLSFALAMPTTFAGVVAAEEAKTYAPGVTVEANQTGKSDAAYQATFVYESDADIEKVTVAGNFQWHLESERDQYKPNNNNDDMHQFRAEDYKAGMYNSSGLHGQEAYELEETSEGHYQVTIPVPGNLYFYDYTVTYADGSKVTMKDPANMPKANPANGHDSGHSLVYVGNGANCTKGQEWIYPRTDGKTGTREYLSYTASDGSTQPLEVYTPYGYDATKEYKTLYVSHGGGGQEAEWMEIGAAANIMDNLIAAGEMAPVVMVTMDNTYFGFNAGKNIINNIIPTIEAKYSVSKNPDDRAFCGLSSGSMQTNELAREYPNEFGYFGAFSGGNRDLDPTHYDKEALQKTGYYVSAGCIDMAYNNTMGISSIDYMKLLDTLEVNYDFELLSGAHDWGVWRESLTRFAKNHLWDVETPSTLPAGPTTVAAENKAGYNTTFVYETNDENVASVAVTGSFVFLYFDDCKTYQAMADNSSIPTYSVYDYEPGMFSTNTSTQNDVTNTYTMTKTAKGRYEITLPLPASMYYYDYVITYTDGTSKTVKDPANMPVANKATGSDAGHSLLRVGSAEGTEEGQEYVYARTDGQTGSYEYYPYKDVNGDTRYIAVYLPYGYDESKTYKTVYISHGGGGNEAEWMTIGAVPEIFDNLIAEGEVEPTVVVAMDNNVYGWNYDVVLPNVLKNIIPFVEKNFSVSKDAEDRAFCGLSMGSMTTNMMAKQYPNEFGYFGAFSGGIQGIDDEYDVEAMNNSVIWMSAGCIDMAYNNKMGIAATTLMEHYDKLGINYTFDLYTGAHDWGFWRHAISTFAKDYLWTTKEEATGTQKIEVIGEEWGPGVVKTIITLDTEVDASSLDVNDFAVTEVKEGLDWGTLEYNTSTAARKVTKVYLSDEAGNPTDAKTGKTITLELYISPSEGSPFIYDVKIGGYNRWCSFYNLEIEKTGVITSEGKEIKGLSVEKEIDLEDTTQTIIPQMEGVEKLQFTASDGKTLSYGSFTPAKDDKTNALVIWLHGSGEGGTDPIVPILGNEVTELFGKEFQETMGGAYVLVPQSPTKWSDSGTGVIYSTGHQQNEDKPGDPVTDSMYVTALSELIKDYVANHPDVDPNRILIGGCSNGGYMTTRMLIAMPEYFAGAYLNSESYHDGYLSDEFIQSLIDDEIGLWYVYCKNDNVALSSVPTTARLENKDNFHVNVYDSVIDTSGRYTDAEGNPHKYSDHWAWIYFFNGETADGELTEWQWMAKQARTPATTPDDGGNTGGTTGGNTTGGTTTNPSKPNVGIYNNVAYAAIATVALAGAAYVAFKKKED